MGKKIDQAMTAAREYARLAARGDVTLAEQAERTIVELVGRYDANGRVALPDPVRRAMAGQE